MRKKNKIFDKSTLDYIKQQDPNKVIFIGMKDYTMVTCYELRVFDEFLKLMQESTLSSYINGMLNDESSLIEFDESKDINLLKEYADSSLGNCHINYWFITTEENKDLIFRMIGIYGVYRIAEICKALNIKFNAID